MVPHRTPPHWLTPTRGPFTTRVFYQVEWPHTVHHLTVWRLHMYLLQLGFLPTRVAPHRTASHCLTPTHGPFTTRVFYQLEWPHTVHHLTVSHLHMDLLLPASFTNSSGPTPYTTSLSHTYTWTFYYPGLLPTRVAPHRTASHCLTPTHGPFTTRVFYQLEWPHTVHHLTVSRLHMDLLLPASFTNSSGPTPYTTSLSGAYTCTFYNLFFLPTRVAPHRTPPHCLTPTHGPFTTRVFYQLEWPHTVQHLTVSRLHMDLLLPASFTNSSGPTPHNTSLSGTYTWTFYYPGLLPTRVAPHRTPPHCLTPTHGPFTTRVFYQLEWPHTVQHLTVWRLHMYGPFTKPKLCMDMHMLVVKVTKNGTILLLDRLLSYQAY